MFVRECTRKRQPRTESRGACPHYPHPNLKYNFSLDNYQHSRIYVTETRHDRNR